MRTHGATQNESVKMAARATVSQILNSYFTALYKEQVVTMIKNEQTRFIFLYVTSAKLL